MPDLFRHPPCRASNDQLGSRTSGPRNKSGVTKEEWDAGRYRARLTCWKMLLRCSRRSERRGQRHGSFGRTITTGVFVLAEDRVLARDSAKLWDRSSIPITILVTAASPSHPAARGRWIIRSCRIADRHRDPSLWQRRRRPKRAWQTIQPAPRSRMGFIDRRELRRCSSRRDLRPASNREAAISALSRTR